MYARVAIIVKAMTQIATDKRTKIQELEVLLIDTEHLWILQWNWWVTAWGEDPLGIRDVESTSLISAVGTAFDAVVWLDWLVLVFFGDSLPFWPLTSMSGSRKAIAIVNSYYMCSHKNWVLIHFNSVSIHKVKRFWFTENSRSKLRKCSHGRAELGEGSRKHV